MKYPILACIVVGMFLKAKDDRDGDNRYCTRQEDPALIIALFQ